MPLCEYGCGQEAIKYFTTTKRWCCSLNANSCPAKRERDATKKRGKVPNWKGGIHPRGMAGKPAWNRGLVTPIDVRDKIKRSLTNNPKCRGIASTSEKEALRRRHISETAKRDGNMGGYREGSGWTKWFLHESPYAGQVSLNGTWEIAYAQYLDAHAISWQRNRKSFSYEWEGKIHKYYPDFYLEQTQEYVEVKGYVVPKDYAKWDSVRKTDKLTVLLREDLITLGVLDTTRKDT